MRLHSAGSIAVMLLAGLAGAQDSRQPARTEARADLVDAVVTDKKGECIRDLTAKDFRVWQDGKEQRVTSAEIQSGAAEKKNYMVVLFDNTTMNAPRQKQIKEALSELVGDPNANLALALAVYSGGMSLAQNFTTDVAQMKKAIDNVPPPGVQSTFAADSGQTASSGNASVASTMVNSGIPKSTAADQDQTMRAFLYDVAALARNMGQVPGRKALVLLSGGFTVPGGALNQFEAAVDACNLADVAIYPVDVRGLSTSRAGLANPAGGLWAGLLPRMGAAFAAWPVSALAAFQTSRSRSSSGTPTELEANGGLDNGMDARQTLDSFAAGTGGFVIRNSNDLVSGLRKIAAEGAEYYTVAYAPPENAKPGCHALRVQVSRGGAQVRSRKNYCTAKP